MHDAVEAAPLESDEAVASSGSLVLGRYRPLRPLGSGGSASVWLARDERDGGEVALKVVPAEGKAGPRAEREVEAAARLDHPRCLRALALARDERHVYVAYEYVRGRTLREALRSGELDDEAAVEAAAQVLEGLAHAHARGVVHRDVKPANIMLAEPEAPPGGADAPPGGTDGSISVRLLDFGLAQLEEAQSLTAAGDVPGTLPYIAPERLNGAPASAAADVWSVGVILWEALAGWHPFAAPSTVETARRIRSGAQPVARSRGDLPQELCALVDAMLDRDPKRRPSAKRLSAALRAALRPRRRPPQTAASRGALRARALSAALAASFAAGSTLVFPFFPRGWPFALGVLAAVVTLRAPRAGLALALAAPVLPLGNISLALALTYAALALVWLALFAADARHGLLFVAGPLLVPVGGLALAPLVALHGRGLLRRAALAGAAPLAAAVTGAGAAGFPSPFREDVAGGGGAALGVEEAGAAFAALAAPPVLALESCVFILAALCAPLARRHGEWGIALWGSAFLAAAVLLPHAAGGAVDARWLVPGVWCAALWLAGGALRERR